MRLRMILSLLLVVAGCGEAPAVDDASVADADLDGEVDAGPCPRSWVPETRGPVDLPALTELSGLAFSRAHAGLVYAHNDSGDGPRVFVLGEDGEARGEVRLTGASSVDYEDIAVGPGADGASAVYVGDVGDNAARDGRGTPRSSVFVHRFPESALDGAGAAVDLDLVPETFELTYPGSPHDCESIAVDPSSGDLYFLSKENAGPSTLYVARAPLADGVLEMLTTVDIGGPLAPGSANTTAMDISPGGRGLLVRTYDRVHLFERRDAESWVDALGRAALFAPSRPEGQGEAIAWAPDGRGYCTSSEGTSPPFHCFFDDPSCPAF